MPPTKDRNGQVGIVTSAGLKALHPYDTHPMEIKMLKNLAIVAALIAAATTTFAADLADVARKFELKDGSTVYVFKDGKMSMEDRLGRTVGMKPGYVMETKDGQKIIMIGNELARLDAIKSVERSGK